MDDDSEELEVFIPDVSSDDEDDEVYLPSGLFRNCARSATLPSGGGRPATIHPESEKRLIDNLFVLARYGYGLNRAEIKELVSEFVIHERIKNRWSDGKPGFEWMKKFLKRHDYMRIRKMEPIRRIAAAVPDPYVVYELYDDLDIMYERESVTPSEACRFYNVAVLSFPAESKNNFSTRCACCNVKKYARDNYMSLNAVVCVGADGKKLPPFIVFQGRCVVPSSKTGPKKNKPGYIAASSRFWSDGNAFSFWFEHIFIPSLPSLDFRNDKSVILFLDYSLLISIKTLILAKRFKVFLVRFPPNTNEYLHPLEIAGLESLKTAWTAQSTTCRNPNLATAQQVFCKVLSFVWNSHFDKSAVEQAFRSAGIFPVNRLKFPNSVFPPSALKRYMDLCSSESNIRYQSVLNVGKYEYILPDRLDAITKTRVITPKKRFTEDLEQEIYAIPDQESDLQSKQLITIDSE